MDRLGQGGRIQLKAEMYFAGFKKGHESFEMGILKGIPTCHRKMGDNGPGLTAFRKMCNRMAHGIKIKKNTLAFCCGTAIKATDGTAICQFNFKDVFCPKIKGFPQKNSGDMLFERHIVF